MSAPPPTMPSSRSGRFDYLPAFLFGLDNPIFGPLGQKYLSVICPDDGAAPAIFGRTRILGFQRTVRYLRVALYCHSDFTTHFRI